MLNEEDEGQRKCILVTNNEVSAETAEKLEAKGLKKGDLEWEAQGIAKAVTFPRTKYSINGHRDDGSILEGEYFTRKSQIDCEERKAVLIDFFDRFMDMKIGQKQKIVSLISGGVLPKSLIKKDSKYIISDKEKHFVSILLDDDFFDEWMKHLEDNNHITQFYIISKNTKLVDKFNDKIGDVLGSIEKKTYLKKPMTEGFKTNVKFFKCDWTPRKPEDYLLSNVLCLHIKEMIELQNGYEVDGIKNVLILTKDDFNKAILDTSIYEQIENIWLNQNMILNAEEMKLLTAKGFKYIPREFFGKELKEAAE